MKYVFKIILILLYLTLAQSWAGDIETEVNPPEPVKNESFFLTFRIKNTGNDTPVITFIPSGAKILGKTEEGVSISTVVINGRFTTTREQNYVYELVSSQPNMVIIRNIKVDIGGKISTHPDLHITVIDQPRRIPDAFMEAQVSKTKAFVGEGIDVNYFLYFKTSMSANDVKEFPKLNRFIKKFHHINAPVETVQYHGEVLKRILAYSARIYPEKPGTATIDPMKISVQIIQNEYNSPFGGFGMGSQRYKNVDLASKSISVEVLPLPSENVPTGFTGLVGEHEFVFTPGKDKYLVNEPIELKLEARGKGALEKLEAPALYIDNGIEQFDTKGEMTEVGADSAKKVFEYTYLARQALTIKNREVSLAYFDPKSGKYVEKKINIPGIIVSGVASTGASGESSNQIKKPNEIKNNSIDDSDFFSRWFNRSANLQNSDNAINLGLVSPLFTYGNQSSGQWVNWANYILIVVILTLLIWVLTGDKSIRSTNAKLVEIKKHIQSIKKNGINYSDLYQIISALDKENMLIKNGVSLDKILSESKISPKAKEYFAEAINSCEGNAFAKAKVVNNIKYQEKYFNELIKKL